MLKIELRLKQTCRESERSVKRQTDRDWQLISWHGYQMLVCASINRLAHTHLPSHPRTQTHKSLFKQASWRAVCMCVRWRTNRRTYIAVSKKHEHGTAFD